MEELVERFMFQVRKRRSRKRRRNGRRGKRRRKREQRRRRMRRRGGGAGGAVHVAGQGVPGGPGLADAPELAAPPRVLPPALHPQLPGDPRPHPSHRGHREQGLPVGKYNVRNREFLSGNSRFQRKLDSASNSPVQEEHPLYPRSTDPKYKNHYNCPGKARVIHRPWTLDHPAASP